MRVGANARQIARIKKMHGQNVPADIIAKTIQMTPQSLEKILAHIDGREERHLASENNPELNQARIENAELTARLAKYEDPEDGAETTEEVEVDETSEETTEEE